MLVHQAGVGNIIKILISLAAALVSVSATAQTTGVGESMSSPNYTTFRAGVEAMQGRGLSETPTMRAQKLERAIALRAEANALLQEDGGKLTAEHAAYVRRKACKILSGKSAVSGTLAPGRRCGV